MLLKEGSSNFPAYLVVRSFDVECSTHFLTVLAAAYKDNKLLYVLSLDYYDQMRNYYKCAHNYR